jgi:Uma2 family endonuclease
VEIVSPDSVDRDYEGKHRRYEAGGVMEYWIIDPMESAATFLVREGDAFVERIPREHRYQSRVLEGFELDVRWLWQRPLPATMPIVRRLLGQE